jgi:S-formylglutathione hydrolase
MSNSLNLQSEYRCFGGTVAYYSHYSQSCNSEMRFSIYLPPQARSQPAPVLYYLSGLTCTEENFTIKAGAQCYASELGIILVAPDTSPRNTGTPGEDETWDLGTGAGFYVDATVEPWSKHYRTYSYVVEELPRLIQENFPALTDKQGIFGHSMGGHGALVCALRNPEQYRSVSAFAPICAPMQCSWGEKAFSAYLGSDRDRWRDYDASALVQKQPFKRPILIDQGTADSFYQQKQLLPEVFETACRQVGQPLTLRLQEGYDHSYFAIATWMEDHIRHHASFLFDKE